VQAEGGPKKEPLAGVLVPGDSRQARLVHAYQAWFIGEDEEEDERERASARPSPPSLVAALLFCTWLGGVLGALRETVEGRRLGAQVGGLLVGLAGPLLGATYENVLRASNGLRKGGFVGGVLGLLSGGALGAVAGAMVVGYLGTIIGAIVGTLTSSG